MMAQLIRLSTNCGTNRNLKFFYAIDIKLRTLNTSTFWTIANIFKSFGSFLPASLTVDNNTETRALKLILYRQVNTDSEILIEQSLAGCSHNREFMCGRPTCHLKSMLASTYVSKFSHLTYRRREPIEGIE